MTIMRNTTRIVLTSGNVAVRNATIGTSLSYDTTEHRCMQDDEKREKTVCIYVKCGGYYAIPYVRSAKSKKQNAAKKEARQYHDIPSLEKTSFSVLNGTGFTRYPSTPASNALRLSSKDDMPVNASIRERQPSDTDW
jgi:hypothetical protein